MSAVSDFLTQPGFWWGVPLGALVTGVVAPIITARSVRASDARKADQEREMLALKAEQDEKSQARKEAREDQESNRKTIRETATAFGEVCSAILEKAMDNKSVFNAVMDAALTMEGMPDKKALEKIEYSIDLMDETKKLTTAYNNLRVVAAAARPRPTGVRATPPSQERPLRVWKMRPRARARRTARGGRPTHWPNSPWRTRRSGWCSTGLSRCATRRSTRPSTAQRCCAPTGSRRPRSWTRTSLPLVAPHVRELVPRGGHPAYRHRGAHGAPGRQDDPHRLRPPDQHRRPHRQHGRARRVGDPSTDAELRQRDTATWLAGRFAAPHGDE